MDELEFTNQQFSQKRIDSPLATSHWYRILAALQGYIIPFQNGEILVYLQEKKHIMIIRITSSLNRMNMSQALE